MPPLSPEDESPFEPEETPEAPPASTGRTLDGGKGDDNLWGGGADRFVFDRESDTDTIHDFEDGLNTLVIKGGLQFSDLDIKQSGADAVINGPADAFSIVIRDFDSSRLTADDFDFIA